MGDGGGGGQGLGDKRKGAHLGALLLVSSPARLASQLAADQFDRATKAAAAARRDCPNASLPKQRTRSQQTRLMILTKQAAAVWRAPPPTASAADSCLGGQRRNP